jgi:hypothetical protein
MKKNLLVGNKNFQYFTLITALLLFPFLKGIAQVSLNSLGVAYTQNFDGLASSGTSSSVPTGWSFVEAGSAFNTNYTAGTGSGTNGDTYSFGASAASDRAFGTLQSGSLNSTLGASFTNSTGSTITSLDISYIGEQWRFGSTGRADQLNFEYSLNATSLTNGTWTSVSALNFVTPNTSTVVGAVNGNLTGNKTSISSNIGSLSIAVGGTVWIRWTDLNVTGADDGLGIDDFSLTPNATAPAAPTKLVITSINPSSPLAGSSFSVIVQSQDGSNAPQNVSQNTAFSLSTNGSAGAIGGTITGTIPSGANSVTVTGVTLPNAGTGVTLTASVTSGDNLSNGVSSTFNVIGVATQLAFVGAPALGFQSTNMASFTVEARRADGSVDNNYTGTVIVSKGNGPGNLTGTTSVNAVAGVATFSVLQFDQIGVYTLNANSGLLTQATSSSINISSNPVTWNFTSGTAAATGVPTNLTVSVLSQGNNNGTTTLITSGSPSSGYPGASGTNNAGAAARTGVLNTGASGSAYFEFTLTPAANNIVTLKGLTFGSRSTGTAPQAFSILSSADNFSSVISTGTLLSNSTWALSSPAFSVTSSGVATPITFRIYGHNGVGSPGAGTANWRVDDILLDLDVQSCSQPTINVNSGAICTGNTFTINPTGGVTYSVTGNSFTVNPTANTDYTVTGADAIGCTNTAIISVTVNALPNITVNTSSASICNGSSSTLTGNAGVTYLWNTGATTSAIVVSPSVTTNYTVTGTDGNGCSNTASLTLTVNNCPATTSLTPVSCGSTVTSLDDILYYHAVSGATNYRVEIVSAQQSYSVVNVRNRTVPDFKLSWIPGTQYGRTYTIRVAAFVAGAWRSFGPACSVTTASVVPTTQLSAGSCSVTLSTLDQTLNFAQVPGATNYRLEITNSSQPLNIVSVRNNTVLNFKLSFFSGIQYNRTYNIRIGAYVNGAWEPYGSICQVTTPSSAPTPSLVAAVCGATVASLGQVVNFTTVSGATNYRVLVTNATQSLSAVNTRNNTQATFALSFIPNTIANRTYDVSVAAFVGGVWGAYGPVCQLTAASASREEVLTNSRIINTENDSEDNTFEFNVYPNPNQGLFNIELTAQSQVMITNTLGQVVLNETIEAGKSNLNIESQPTGIYFVKVMQNKKQKTLKLIKE